MSDFWLWVALIALSPLWVPIGAGVLAWEWLSDIPGEFREYRRQTRKRQPLRMPKWKPKRRSAYMVWREKNL